MDRAGRLIERTARARVPPGVLTAGVVILFCAVFACLVMRFALSASATYDEVTHLPSGYSYLRWGDYRMNPEHPPLVKMLAALPWLSRPVWPSDIALRPEDASRQAEGGADRAIRRYWAAGIGQIDMQWYFGHLVLYGLTADAQKRLRVPSTMLVPGTERLTRGDFRNDADDLLFRGRMPVMLLGVALAVLVFRWAREMFGLAGGVLAMALWCFDPNAIAHSGLVTTDVGVTLFMFGALYFQWRACRRLDAVGVTLFLICFGAAFVTKFSGALLVPMCALAAVGRIADPERWTMGARGRIGFGGVASRAAAVGALLAAGLLAAYLAIWAVYGFRYSAARDPAAAARSEEIVGSAASLASMAGREPGHLPIGAVVQRSAATRAVLRTDPRGESPGFEQRVSMQMQSAPVTWSGRLLLFAHAHELLPEAYLYGFAHAELKSLRRGSYLNGEYSSVGFRSYFAWTFLLKTPVPALSAVAAAIVVAIKRRVPWRSRLAFIAAPVGLYLAVSLASSLNIGHRHLLPIYPFLYVMCGVLATEWRRWRAPTRYAVAVVALLAVVVSCAFVFAPPWRPTRVDPHYLAYFNELGGGPRKGYRHLVDSNLDWGQDLKELRAWLDGRGVSEPIYLCYFGMADPRYHQIPHINMPGGYGMEPQEEVRVGGGDPPRYFVISNVDRPGLLAISATALAGVYLGPQGRLLWNEVLKDATLIDTIGYSMFVYAIRPSLRPIPWAQPTR